MKLLTSEQMREVDRRTMAEIGIPGTTLMENAGIGVVHVLEEHFDNLEALQIAVVCGRGNNGGDGFVIARQLFMRGIVPHVFILARMDDVQGDARINLEIIRRYQAIPLFELPDAEHFEAFRHAFQSYQLIVDAIVGTGRHKPVDGYLAEVIQAINDSPAQVVAVDIPSGLFADEYRPVETAVYADITVTFTAAKPGLLLGEACTYVGSLYTIAIGTPDFLIDRPEHTINLVGLDEVKGFFLPRKKDTHKGNYGHLLVVGGGLGKTGAVKLAGLAGLRSGAGLVTVGVPEPYAGWIVPDCPELMAEPLRAAAGGFVGPGTVDEVLRLLETRDLLVLGPGLGLNPDTTRFVHELLPRLEVPAVVDADAVSCLAADLGILEKVKVPLVLTPHPGEMARLCGCKTGEIQENREQFAREFATRYGLYLVLKGFRTVIADPDGQVWINPTGNPGMATAGSGDVLSGMLGAFCARINHQNPEAWVLATTAAVYLHGLAGDIAAEAFREECLIARDIINQIHTGMQKITET